MLKIYGSDLSGPSNKVRFVANFLNLKYDYQRINLRAGEHKLPEFLKFSPAGKVPAIDDDGFTLFESGAIAKYLADKNTSDLYPKDSQRRAVVNAWTDYASFHVGIPTARVMYNRVFAPLRGIMPDENAIKSGLQDLDLSLPVIENQLSKNKFLSGDKITLADMTLLAILDPVEAAGIDISKYQKLNAWRTNLAKQDFYTKCHKSYLDALNNFKQNLKK